MKPKKIKLRTTFLLLLPLCVVLLGVRCNEDGLKNTTEINSCSESYESIKSLKDAIGIVGFDTENNEYILNIYQEGTIDEIITAYPCKLNDEFNEIGLKVKFDGNLFKDNDLPEPSLGGQEIFRIDIKAISISK